MFLGIVAVFFAGCSSIPQEEIDAANAAIEEARLAGADKYASDEFVVLQDSLKSAMVLIESEKSKLIKNYGKARESFEGVSAYAGTVKQMAGERVEELKAEIQSTLDEARNLIESDRSLILQAPKGKEGTSALMAIKAEVDGVESSVAEAEGLFQKGDYLVCLDKAKAAKQKAASINTELSEVIAKYKSNVRK